MKTIVHIGLLCCALSLGIATEARTQSSKTKLPPAIDAAFKKAYPHASITRVSREGKDYELETLDAAQKRDLIYKADGALVSYEEAVTANDVPEAVLTAVKTRYPGITLTVFEKVVAGERVSYEVAGRHHGKRLELELSPEGTWVSPK